MHEQEFERSVQQKMEELSFTPSAPVWERVEAGIRSRRKKRPLVFWLLPLGVMMAAAGLYFFVSPLDTTSGTLPEVATSEAKGKASKAQHLNQSSGTRNRVANYAPSLKQLATGGMPVSQVTRIVKKKHGQKSAAAAFPSLDEAIGNVAVVTEASFDSLVNTTRPKNRQATLIPVLEANRSKLLHALSSESSIPHVLSSPLKMPLSPKWQLSLQLHYGRSQLATPGMASPASLDFSRGPLQNSAPGFFMPAVRVEDGPYVAGKIGLRTRIGARWYLKTGLQYARYTQRVAVGQKVHVAGFSGSGTFYDPVNTDSYYFNRFHLAGIPLGLQHKPFRKVPLELEAGFAPGYLFGAKALRLDSATRLYVVHKPALRRLQVPVVAGIQYRFAKDKSWEWLAGAQLQYGLTGINTRSNGPRLYSLSMGVQVRRK